MEVKKDSKSRTTTSFSLDSDLLRGLRNKSMELSQKHDTKISASSIIEKALLKFGVEPCPKPQAKK